MSLFTFNFPSNFRDTVAEIDDLEPGDEASVWNITIPFGDQVVARQTTFEGFGPEGTDTLVVYEDLLQGTTVFTVSDDAQQLVSRFSMAGLLDLEGGFELQAAIEALGGNPDYISLDAGNVIDALGGAADEMIGEGVFYGRSNGDKIELEALDGSLLGSTELRSKAYGGAGADILKAAVQSSLLKGGSGADTLVVEFGRSTVNGGNGNDSFVFDNGFWDLDGTPLQSIERSRVTVQDFDGDEDVLIFASVDSDMDAGDPVERETLEDLFGAGDLSDLSAFVEDGVIYRFRQNEDGDAVLIRKGTDSEGRSYDERITLKGTSLDEVDRADVVLQDYAAETYEFF